MPHLVCAFSHPSPEAAVWLVEFRTAIWLPACDDCADGYSRRAIGG